MKNKPWKNTQTAIELTSLLDVIFIVLMIVVCNQQINTKAREESAQAQVEAAASAEAAYEEKLLDARQQEQAAKQLLQEAEQLKAEQEEVILEKEFYAQQLNTYAQIGDEILPVTVYVDYEPSDIKNRTIRILCAGQELPSISVTPDTMTEAFLKLKTALADVLKEHKDTPVIVAVSRQKILYRDEKAVTEALQELGSKFSNLYLKAEKTEGAEDE